MGSNAYTVAVLRQDGSIAQEFDFPRVTHILDSVIAKPRLMAWYYKMGLEGVAECFRRFGAKMPLSDAAQIAAVLKQQKLSPWGVRDKAADGGTSLHKEFQYLCETGLMPGDLTSENQGMWNWWQARGLAASDIIATERTLVSFRHRYAGTVDCIYKDPATGLIILTDLKTGKYVHWTHFLQGEAYREAWVEEGGQVPDKVTVLHTNPIIGGDNYAEKVAQELSFDTFRAILDVYHVLPLDWNPEEI